MDRGHRPQRRRADLADHRAYHPCRHHSGGILPLRAGACNANGDHAAIGNATKHGFLVREGDALERLAKAKVIAFDKTGTLTCGTPEVTAAESVSAQFGRDEVYRLAASAEQLSEHPLGKAIVGCCRKTGAVLAAISP